jgi:hypothetical protein
MAGAQSLRPISFSKTACQPRRAGGFGLLGIGAWACLLGMSAAQPTLRADEGSLRVPCKIEQKKPLYVGFAEHMGLDRFEESAGESRYIIREIKHWVCDDGVDSSMAVPSLQLAFARSYPLQIQRLQFDDSELMHAHVLLSDAADAKSESWRVDLVSVDDTGWAVTHTNIARPEDLANP